MSNFYSLKAFGLTAFLALLGACAPGSTPQSTLTSDLLLNSSALISGRPLNQVYSTLLVKLSLPPAIQSLVKNEQGVSIEPSALKAIEKEQSDFLENLKSISPSSEVIYSYRKVLNGMALKVLTSDLSKIREIPGLKGAQFAQALKRPAPLMNPTLPREKKADLSQINSVNFIGADKVHQKLRSEVKEGVKVPVLGQNIKVGIIDTGIDYTHEMLGGVGTKAAYEAVDPDSASDYFPNTKVAGGMDFVGTEYNAASIINDQQFPTPDLNPIDEAGHGTHVAGSVAGLGDGENTYSGVAPGADLYALKVFGKNGSTSDAVVVAAFEYSVDPNDDGKLNDRIHVLNLSLGSEYGQPVSLYSEAVAELTRFGTVIVASAGNSGDKPFIVGSPSSSVDAISVAASVDHMPHNWQFSASKIQLSPSQSLLIKAIQGPISKPVEEAPAAAGNFVYAGLADKDFSSDLKAKLKGQVALIDRGAVTFASKVKRAFDAGAVGAVIVNQVEGPAFAMGGDGKFDIPAIMVNREIGAQIKQAMKTNEVGFKFLAGEKINEPQLVDTIAGFSSRGPRSQDGAFKPEVAAPGQSIISAKMAAGYEGVQMSGTSMAGPHMAGVMALLKQYRPNLSVKELKSIALQTTKRIRDENGKDYPLSRQGTGRVQTYQAAVTPVILTEPAVSFGIQQVNQSKNLRKKWSLKNTTEEPIQITFKKTEGPGVRLSLPESLELAPKGSSEIWTNFSISKQDQSPFEYEGLIDVYAGETWVGRVSLYALGLNQSQLATKELTVLADSQASSPGAAVNLVVENQSIHKGEVLAFNFLGKDEKKPSRDSRSSFRSRECDLQALGYRVIERQSETGPQQFLQFAAKLFGPLTTWNACQLSIQIDGNNDGLVDQELAGLFFENGAQFPTPRPLSLLVDAKKMLELRKKIEAQPIDQDGKVRSFDPTPAILDFQEFKAFDQSGIAIVEAKLELIQKSSAGEISIQVIGVHQDSDSIQRDDFFKNTDQKWMKLGVDPLAQSFKDIPEVSLAKAKAETLVPMTKGEGQERLVVFYPQNRFRKASTGRDPQMSVHKPKFESLNLFSQDPSLASQ